VAGRNEGTRINAYLARAGIASRRAAEELVRAGRVRVNGEPATLPTVVRRGDRVEVDGREVGPEPLAHILLNKPAGVVTTARDPQGRPTVVGLVKHRTRVVPVGRLDADTTGALLLTNDGPLAYRLAHPRFGVEKVYEALVVGIPTASTLHRLREGVELEDGMTARAGARILARRHGEAMLELTLHEGRTHQVRRMCEAVGHPLKRLRRNRYAGLTVEGLAPGAWRELSRREVAALRSLAGLTGGTPVGPRRARPR
jgi:pseudouridine synthase